MVGLIYSSSLMVGLIYSYFGSLLICLCTADARGDDLIMISDVDEIPDPHVLHLLASCDGWDETGPVQLYTRFYNFKF